MSSPVVSTYINFLLDRSQSMRGLRDTVIEGMNEFLNKQRENPAYCHVNITAFSEPDDYATVVNGNVQSIANFTKETYDPMGASTAFYDAAIRSIDEVGTTLRNMPESARPGHVLFYMVTDGLNNDFVDDHFSTAGGHLLFDPTRATRRIKALKERIIHQTEKYSWQFLYLGTNQDAVLAAAEIGLKPFQAATYNNTKSGTRSVFTMAANKASMYRSANFDAMQVTAQDRDDLNKA